MAVHALAMGIARPDYKAYLILAQTQRKKNLVNKNHIPIDCNTQGRTKVLICSDQLLTILCSLSTFFQKSVKTKPLSNTGIYV